MRIQHNIAALNNYNNVSKTTTEMQKTYEKLSSGYKVNKAADDAAGLAISEKMRGQIRGLEKAEQNILDGISLVQVADSGLGEISNPNLIRIRELAIQAANDTLTDDDRALIQLEIDEIKNGIEDIAINTEFNTIKLLSQETMAGFYEIENAGDYLMNKYLSLGVAPDGSFDLRTNQGYPGSENDDNQILIYGYGKGTTQPSLLLNGGQQQIKNFIKQETTLSNETFKTIYQVNDIEVTQYVKLIEDHFEIKYSIQNKGTSEQNAGFYFHMDTMLGNDDRAPFNVNNQNLINEQAYGGTNLPSTFEVYNNQGNPELKAQGKITGDGIIEAPDELRIGEYNRISSVLYSVDSNENLGDSGYSLKWNERILAPGEKFEVNTFYGLAVPPQITESVWTPSTVDPNHLILQVGPNEGQQFKVVLTDARIDALGISDLNVLTQQNAENAISIIDKAIGYVSRERSKYGAYMNALEHIQNNVGNAKENLTNAESILRDTDVAKEMTKLQKEQVLLQASQSMMAQINQMSQGILQLLK